MKSPYIYFETEFGSANIGANAAGDGDVLITFSSHPANAMMCVPMSAAIELANRILQIASTRVEKAA